MIKTKAYAAQSATTLLARSTSRAAYERILKSYVKYRFVIDMATLR